MTHSSWLPQIGGQTGKSIRAVARNRLTRESRRDSVYNGYLSSAQLIMHSLRLSHDEAFAQSGVVYALEG